MAQQAKGLRLAATLWFVAAGLALLAFGVRYTSDREMNWSVGAGGLFCLVMGISALARARSTPPT